MSARSFAMIAFLALAVTSWSTSGRAAGPTTEPSEVQERLDLKLPEVNLQAVPINDVFEFLQEITQVPFEPDWDALGKAGIAKDSRITLKFTKKKLSEVLDEIVRQLNAKSKEPLAYKATGDAIVISTKALMAQK
jgi:hypothetical protein